MRLLIICLAFFNLITTNWLLSQDSTQFYSITDSVITYSYGKESYNYLVKKEFNVVENPYELVNLSANASSYKFPGHENNVYLHVAYVYQLSFMGQIQIDFLFETDSENKKVVNIYSRKTHFSFLFNSNNYTQLNQLLTKGEILQIVNSNLGVKTDSIRNIGNQKFPVLMCIGKDTLLGDKNFLIHLAVIKTKEKTDSCSSQIITKDNSFISTKELANKNYSPALLIYTTEQFLPKKERNEYNEWLTHRREIVFDLNKMRIIQDHYLSSWDSPVHRK
ncbi:hypothetical protein K6119_11250 [Paracrocinitomix mangrovi]|uniref:hypothetical protein n=1 Tax=Paracrocinitomix mangrovi TaxID=2862509 RepID=UPI001C8D2510|nr:hypothetical protein [Paracrocinitomix mangrovi]UKN00310.1 hypothetical protein K6119_11250 [Paracrocinitomix mangrovi]